MASQNTSIYPIAIDGFQQIPLFVDGMSLITADGINRYRSAIINLESTLGIAPHISEKYQGFSNVSERLDFLDGIVSSLDKRVDEISFQDLQSVTDDGNITTNKIIASGFISNGDLIVNGNISFDTIDANLNDLNDVKIELPSVGDSLVWNGKSWVSRSAQVSLSSNDLTDVNSSDPNINDTLIWRGGFWTSGQVSLSSNDLTDVNSSDPDTNDALIWSGESWEPGKISRAALNREEVEDIVGEMFLDAGHVAIDAEYNDDLGKIKLKNGIKYLESLFNVSADLPEQGDVLSWKDGEWRPIEPLAAESPMDEEEVEDIVGLMFDGGIHSGVSTEYNDDIGAISITNNFDQISRLLDTDIDAPSDEQILSYDSASNMWKNVDLEDNSLLHVRTISTDDFEGSSGFFDIQDFDDVILCDFADAGAVDITLNLPNPGLNGRSIIIKDKNSINTLGTGQAINIATSGGMLIDGSTEFILNSINQSITIVCDGSNYWVV